MIGAFLKGGGLSVSGGEDIITPIFDFAKKFDGSVIASTESHEEGGVNDYTSYVGVEKNTPIPNDAQLSKLAKFTKEYLDEYLANCEDTQFAWNVHARPGTPECELHPLLRSLDFRFVINKGTDPLCDSNSALKDNLGRLTHAVEKLNNLMIKRLVFVGLAFDFCVGLSAYDAKMLGFDVIVVRDLTRSVGIPANGDYPGSIAVMEQKLKDAGVVVVNSIDELQFI